jgi:hypothetical protein
MAVALALGPLAVAEHVTPPPAKGPCGERPPGGMPPTPLEPGHELAGLTPLEPGHELAGPTPLEPGHELAGLTPLEPGHELAGLLPPPGALAGAPQGKGSPKKLSSQPVGAGAKGA